MTAAVKLLVDTSIRIYVSDRHLSTPVHDIAQINRSRWSSIPHVQLSYQHWCAEQAIWSCRKQRWCIGWCTGWPSQQSLLSTTTGDIMSEFHSTIHWTGTEAENVYPWHCSTAYLRLGRIKYGYSTLHDDVYSRRESGYKKGCQGYIQHGISCILQKLLTRARTSIPASSSSSLELVVVGDDDTDGYKVTVIIFGVVSSSLVCSISQFSSDVLYRSVDLLPSRSASSLVRKITE